MKLTNQVILSGYLDHNSRVYTDEVLLEAANKINTSKMPMYGELNPAGDRLVSLSKVSHVVTNAKVKYQRLPRKYKKFMKRKGKYGAWRRRHGSLFADIKILDTPAGRLVKSFGKNLISFASRGIGIIDGGEVTGFKFISADIVPNYERPTK